MNGRPAEGSGPAVRRISGHVEGGGRASETGKGGDTKAADVLFRWGLESAIADDLTDRLATLERVVEKLMSRSFEPWCSECGTAFVPLDGSCTRKPAWIVPARLGIMV